MELNVTRLLWSWFNTFSSSNWLVLWVFAMLLLSWVHRYSSNWAAVFSHSRMESQHWWVRVSRAMRKWWKSSSKKGLLLTCRQRYYLTGHFITCFLLEGGAIFWNASSVCGIHNALVVTDVWQWAKMPLLTSYSQLLDLLRIYLQL